MPVKESPKKKKYGELQLLKKLHFSSVFVNTHKLIWVTFLQVAEAHANSVVSGSGEVLVI